MKKTMARCFLKLDTRRPLKDGTFPVKIGVGYGKNVYVGTDVSLSPDEWDDARREVVGPRANRLNDLLSSAFIRTAARVLRLREEGRFKDMSAKDLSRLLTAYDMDAAEEEAKRKPLLEIARECLGTKDAKKTREVYALTISKLEAFISKPGKFYVEDITKAWLHDFQASIGGKVNSQAIHMRNLRHVCNFALDEGYTSVYPFRKFHIKTEETRKKALTVKQLRAVRDADVSNPFVKEHRDMFLLMFYMRGINVGDLASLTKENIVNGRIEYRRSKTGRLFSVKLELEMKEILRSHKGKKHLLAPFDRYANPKDYVHHMNAVLKTLTYPNGRHIEKDLSSNWARHTWATIAAELDIPDPTITLGMGHATAGNKTTAIYIKRDRDKVDEANRKIIDYVNGSEKKKGSRQ